MRAIVVTRGGGPEVLELRDVPAPEPGSGQVVVEVEAVGVNYRDIYERQGAGDDGDLVAGVGEPSHPHRGVPACEARADDQDALARHAAMVRRRAAQRAATSARRAP
jgi:NADPH:quinone reductase-like Zn-dependent oxidoreductase